MSTCSNNVIEVEYQFLQNETIMPISQGWAASESTVGIIASVCRLLRGAALVGATITILTLLTIGTSQACTTNDSPARAVTEVAAHAVVKVPVVAAARFEITAAQDGNCGETSGSSHHSCCPGPCCSSCSLALNNVTNATIAPTVSQNIIARDQTSTSPLELDGQFRPPRIYS